jgi:Glyoxalase-like domain
MPSMSPIPYRIKIALRLKRGPTRPSAKLSVVFLAVSWLSGAELQIDHVTVAGKNLEAMRAALKAVGIPSEYGGAHSNHATEMAQVSFPDGSYLELIAIQPQADPAAVDANPWSKALKSDGGPCAFAVRATKALDKPEAGGRTRPDGKKIAWETSDSNLGPRGSFFPFLIRDVTPREDRVYPSGKPTTDLYRGVGKVVIAVRELDASIASYRHAYGLPAPRAERSIDLDATLAVFEGTPVVLASGGGWLTQRIREYGEAPCAFVLIKKGSGKIVWFDEARLGWRLGVQ